MQKVQLSRPSSAHSLWLKGASALLLVGSVAMGCVSPIEGLPDDGGGAGKPTDPDTGTGAGKPVEVDTLDEAKDYYFKVDPLFSSTCGSCHGNAALQQALFLEGTTKEARYERVKSWDKFVRKNWETSTLLTYPHEGAAHPSTGSLHSGTNFEKAAPSLEADLAAWLQAESSLIVESTNPLGPGTEPFAPIMGVNAIYLDEIDSQLYGVTLTFTAYEEGGFLYIKDFRAYTSTVTGVTLVDPAFAVYPAGKPAVKDRSNVGLKKDIPAGSVEPIGNEIGLGDWVPGAMLALYFTDVKPYTAGTIDEGGCEDLEAFTGGVGGQPAAAEQFRLGCGACHGNGTNNRAFSAIDMRGLTSGAPTGPKDACGQIRIRVAGDFENPNNSLIFRNTDPGNNANHPFKFGNAGAFNTFRNSVTAWMQVEAAAQ
ncbi:hypothetical protein [Chondromyces crocatus]|uniref:Uncharacterized protein n=1 Tax=Chondromyces crocatus TaxID=52 RepID=A0A0K1EQW7_CHOCO|nr:hypothetical protein [Chondromyces crocatus]AKT43018.1 uncharacterized protein CMC5_072450 [Chondromyces crocatus]